MRHSLIGIAVLGILGYSYIPSQYFKWRTSGERRREREKVVYLTFDDGPSREYTPRLLEVLRKNGVKAAFFIVSDFAEEMPQIIEKMKEDGHLVCIHSKSHKSLLYRGPKKSREDLDASLEMMRKLGLGTKYYRPPWGHLNLFLLYYMKKKNLQPVMWNVMVGDWEANVKSEELERRLFKQTKPGSIICLHDGRGAEGAPGRTIEALESFIPKLQEEGFAFRRLDTRYERESLG